jgi:hypothetical protein
MAHGDKLQQIIADAERNAVRYRMSREEVAAMLAAQQARESATLRAIQTFVEAAITGDLKAFAASLGQLDTDAFALGEAFRRVAREAKRVPMSTRRAFLFTWFSHGDHWRCEIGDDLLLADALRAQLPPYRGTKPVELYRGDSAYNRRRRTYGPCWSRSRFIAQQHAEQWCAYCPAGSVLLQTLAPPSAIICAPATRTYSNEQEYIVDRRRLRRVTLLQRYPFKEREPPRA